VTVARLDIGADLLCPGTLPQALKIVVEVPQIAHGVVVSQGAAGPDVAVGGQVRV